MVRTTRVCLLVACRKGNASTEMSTGKSMKEFVGVAEGIGEWVKLRRFVF